jgi:hypothetical protein
MRLNTGLHTTGVATNGAARDAYDTRANAAASWDAPVSDANISFGSKLNFAGQSPYAGGGLKTPVASPRPASSEPLATVPPSPGPAPSSSGQASDLARKALVDHARSAQAREQRAPAIDVAVIADINKRALNLRYARTFEQSGLSGSSSGTYITRAGLTATQTGYAEKTYANEVWSRLVNDANP